MSKLTIAIHQNKDSFSDRWIQYCVVENIPYKIVNCYDSDIIENLKGCDALMWHHNHMNAKDILFAKSLMFSLEQSGMVVFPDFRTAWHFDDKVGQKYLLEVIDAPLVPSFIFFTRQDAMDWIQKTSFPKVFKLRGGGASWNVMLAKTSTDAIRLINKAFGKGFKQYNPITNLFERWRKYRLGRISFISVIKGIWRIFYEPTYSKVMGRERGYVYFQDFIPNNDYDIRVIVIDKKAFAIKRMVRENDFRASGSGNILYQKTHFDDATIKLSFELATKLKSQSAAFDFVYKDGKPLVVEVSYGFVKEGYVECPGYWDSDFTWHEGPFNPYGWMVETIIKSINRLKENDTDRQY